MPKKNKKPKNEREYLPGTVIDLSSTVVAETVEYDPQIEYTSVSSRGLDQLKQVLGAGA